MSSPPDLALSPEDPTSESPTRIARLVRIHPALRTGRRLAEDLAQQARTPRLATGLDAVDRLLGGGFPRGGLSEITGPLSSGRTSLAVALAAAATRAGEVAAWIDPSDALDPSSLEAAGVVAERLLWVRPTRTGDALRCAERLLLARGFALVVLDCDPADARQGQALRARPDVPEGQALRARPDVPEGQALRAMRDARAGAWLRLTRCASASATALVLLGRQPALGSFAALAVDLCATRLRFTERPAWLEGLEARIALARARSRPAEGFARSAEGFAPVCWKVPPVARDHPEPGAGTP